jgi:acetyl-CoA C-acetyltransferase
MSIRGKAFIAGAYEHPLREIPDRSTAQVHAEVALGAVADAGLSLDDVDAYFCAADAPGFGALSMADYLGLKKLSYLDSTEMGGASYVAHVGHAAAAIAAGKCSVALITLAGRPRHERMSGGARFAATPEAGFESLYGGNVVSTYALAARRHMYEFGTTSEQLAEIKVAASLHAQHNPDAFLPKAVTVEEVVESRLISDPLHLLDCCVITDGGGALVVVSPAVAKSLQRRSVKVLGHGEATKNPDNGRIDLTYTGAVWSGPRAFDEAGVAHADIDYASIYDSFTITVLQQIEDLGFCAKGEGGPFASGGRIAPGGDVPLNTNGGGLSYQHPGMYGLLAIVEAARQLRGESTGQVEDCHVALAHGNGGVLSAQCTVVLGDSSTV